MNCSLKKEVYCDKLVQVWVAFGSAMADYSVVLLPGDGTGPEVIKQAKKVLDVIGEKTSIGFNYETINWIKWIYNNNDWCNTFNSFRFYCWIVNYFFRCVYVLGNVTEHR